MKKIALMIDTMNNGGAQRVVSRLSSILSEEFEIYIILYEDTYKCYKLNSELINLDIASKKSGISGKILQFIKRQKRLKQVKEKYELDMVISFLESPNFVNILSKTKKCKTVISVRNYTQKENKSSTIGAITDIGIKILYRRADKIIAVSQLIARDLTMKYRIDQDKIAVIYNPYDYDEIQLLSTEKIEIEFSNFMADGKIFISVGRQIHQKGFWHLVKAFKIVNDSCKNTKLVIVGRDEQKSSVKNLVSELNLMDSVLFVGYHANPFKFVKASSVYVMSSLFEGFPNSMVEAMTCGCPVIAADCKSGPKEILKRKPDLDVDCTSVELCDFGVLVPALEDTENWLPDEITANEKVLADAMIMLITDDKMRNMYKELGVNRAKEFDYNTCRLQYTNLINEAFKS